MGISNSRVAYMPFQYPWAYAAAQEQMQIHWIKDEVDLSEDVKDWSSKLLPKEKEFLSQLFRFFTQADVDVARGYINNWMPMFGGHPEVAMMLTQFAAMEGIHVDAYAHLMNTIGMDESEYSSFLQYKEMVAKHDYLSNVNIKSRKDVAKALAIYAAFTEGLQLFSSFAMLLNFPRHGKMKGMGTVVEFSIRDETLHCASMIQLFHTYIQENKDIWDDELKHSIYQACREMVELEDAFIDLAFTSGEMQGLTAQEVKLYVRFTADRRLLQLGLKPNYGVKDHPLPWLAEMLSGVEHTNFFENRVTSYSKGGLTGSWAEVFG